MHLRVWPPDSTPWRSLKDDTESCSIYTKEAVSSASILPGQGADPRGDQARRYNAATPHTALVLAFVTPKTYDFACPSTYGLFFILPTTAISDFSSGVRPYIGVGGSPRSHRQTHVSEKQNDNHRVSSGALPRHPNGDQPPWIAINRRELGISALLQTVSRHAVCACHSREWAASSTPRSNIIRYLEEVVSLSLGDPVLHGLYQHALKVTRRTIPNEELPSLLLSSTAASSIFSSNHLDLRCYGDGNRPNATSVYLPQRHEKSLRTCVHELSDSAVPAP